MKGTIGQGQAAFLALAIVLATLLNGAFPFLKRIGLVDRQAYVTFLDAHCASSRLGSGEAVGGPCRCVPSGPRGSPIVPSWSYIYEDEGRELLAKTAKDAIFLILAVACLCRLSREPLASLLRTQAPLLPMLASVALGLMLVWPGQGLAFGLVGLRPYVFLALALLGPWLVGGVGAVSIGVVVILVIQVILVAIEAYFGMPLRTCPHAFRAAGASVMPNSLGIFAAVAFAFFHSFGPRKSWRAPLFVLALFLVLASRSGTGLVVLAALAMWVGFPHVVTRYKLPAAIGAALLVCAFAAGLPMLLSRPDIFRSIEGRVESLQGLVTSSTVPELLFGRGLAWGSNALEGATRLGMAFPGTSHPVNFSSESMVTMLLIQLGLVGVTVFYATLGWAFWRDDQARIFLAAVGIASLAANISELFPVNLLLGIGLAVSVARTRLGCARP